MIPPTAFPAVDVPVAPARKSNFVSRERLFLPEGFLFGPPVRRTEEQGPGFVLSDMPPREETSPFPPDDRITHEDALSRFLLSSDSKVQPYIHPYAQAQHEG